MEFPMSLKQFDKLLERREQLFRHLQHLEARAPPLHEPPRRQRRHRHRPAVPYHKREKKDSPPCRKRLALDMFATPRPPPPLPPQRNLHVYNGTPLSSHLLSRPPHQVSPQLPFPARLAAALLDGQATRRRCAGCGRAALAKDLSCHRKSLGKCVRCCSKRDKTSCIYCHADVVKRDEEERLPENPTCWPRLSPLLTDEAVPHAMVTTLHIHGRRISSHPIFVPLQPYRRVAFGGTASLRMQRPRAFDRPVKQITREVCLECEKSMSRAGYPAPCYYCHLYAAFPTPGQIGVCRQCHEASLMYGNLGKCGVCRNNAGLPRVEFGGTIVCRLCMPTCKTLATQRTLNQQIYQVKKHAPMEKAKGQVAVKITHRKRVRTLTSWEVFEIKMKKKCVIM